MAHKRSKAGRAARSVARASTRTISGLIFLILKIIGTVLLIAVTTGVMFSVIFAFYIRTTVESQLGITFEEYDLEQTSYMYYNGADSTKTVSEDEGEGEEESDGELLEQTSEEEEYSEVDGLNAEDAKLWTEIKSKTQRTWINAEDIPQYMRDAAVAIEDKRYYEHDGVDWYRTAGAFYTMFFGGEGSSTFGASTITQQLIKNLTKEDDVTVKRKIMEIFRALEVESNYSKDEILTWYLNVIYLGQNSYGVEAAAETYFDKDASELSLAECAAIIGITNLPTKYDPYFSVVNNKERQEDILKEMYEQNYITYDEYEQAVNEQLNFKEKQTVEEGETEVLYSYYQETVIDDVVKAVQEEKDLSEQAAQDKVYYGGYRIYTCIDQSIQDKVDSIYEDLSEIPSVSGGSGQVQSAITIQDPETGYIVALSGGVGEKTTNFGFNRATDAARPPGSSIKPLTVYGPALDTNVITTGSTFLDSPITLPNGETWPQNDNRIWTHQNITITKAVQSSINTIAVRVLQETGTDVAYEYLTERLGVTTGIDEAHDINLAPLALGQLYNGATVREMTSAFAAIANDGMYNESKTFYLVTDANGETVIDNRNPKSSTAFKASTADTLTALLYNAVQNGTGTNAILSSGMAVAGKTGTTGDNKDRWFCGYTPYYAAAVWTGYDIGAPMSVYGNPAAQLWKKVMTLVHEDLEVIYKFDTDAVLYSGGGGGSSSKVSPSPSSTDDEDATTSGSASPSPTNSPSPTTTPAPSPSPTPTTEGGGGGESSTQPDDTATVPPEEEYGQEQNLAYKRKDGKRKGEKSDGS